MLEVPKAPGAPPGQRGMGDWICAEARSKDENSMADRRCSFILKGRGFTMTHGHVKADQKANADCKMKNAECY